MTHKEELVALIQSLSAEERRLQPDPMEWLKQHDIADDGPAAGGGGHVPEAERELPRKG